MTEDSDVNAMRTFLSPDDSAAKEFTAQLTVLRMSRRQATRRERISLPAVKAFGIFAQNPRLGVV